jgi:hypothetical protein
MVFPVKKQKKTNKQFIEYLFIIIHYYLFFRIPAVNVQESFPFNRSTCNSNSYLHVVNHNNVPEIKAGSEVQGQLAGVDLCPVDPDAVNDPVAHLTTTCLGLPPA